jgi:outer membrane protein TolC
MMKKAKRMLLALTLLGTVNAFAASEESTTLRLTLPKAIEIAVDENPTIKVADQDIELKKVSRTEAWQNLLPTVDLTGSMQYTIKAATMKLGGNSFKMGSDGTSTWAGALSVSLPLYAPTVYKSMNLSKTDVELAIEKSRGSRLDLVDQVTKAYYQLLLAQDSYKVLLGSYSYSERNFKMVEDKYKVGSVSEFDKISAEVQMNNIKPNVVSAENAIKLAKLQLKVLLGIGSEEIDVEIDDNLQNYESMVTARDWLTETNVENNTNMKQLDLNEKLLNQTLSMQKANFLPTLAASYSFQYQSLYNNNFEIWHYDWSPSSSVALSLSIPLYHASNFTKLKSTRIQINQLQETRANTERQLRMQAQSYLNNMTTGAEQMESTKTSISQAEKALQIAEKRYEVGKGTVLELNSSEVALTQAQLTYHQSIYDFLSAKADLDYVLGKE